jgi:hypothetical protein
MILRVSFWRYKGPIFILLFVLLANILYISGSFKSNPADIYSGLDINTKVGLISSAQPTIDPNNAYTTQSLGHRGALDVLHGHLPWWNYDEQVGSPMAGEMQSASLFLPFSLLLAFANGVLYFHILLEVIAGLATYYLIRRLKFNETVAITAGTLYALNGTFAWLTNAAFNPIALLPCLLLGIELIFTESKKNRLVGQAIVALALAYSLYAGFPETALLDGLFATAWSLTRLWQYRHEYLKYLPKLVVGAGIGLMLAAPILIAFKDYYPYADVGGHNGTIGYYAALPKSSIAALVMPYVYGPIFGFTSFDNSGVLAQFWDNVGGYLSLSLIFLALIGLFKAKDKLLARLLGVWVLITIARTYGFPGVGKVINLIPGMSDVAFYRYVPPSFELAIVLLAAMGLNYLLRARNLNLKEIAGFVSVISLLALAVIIIAYHESSKLYLAPHHRLWLALSVLASVGCFAVIVIAILGFRNKIKYVIPAALILEAVLMFMIPNLSSPRSTMLDTAPVKYLQAHLATSRFFSLGPIMPNYGSYYGIAAINTNDLPIATSWSNYISSRLDSNVTTIGGFTGVNQTSPNGITPIQALFKNINNYERVGVKYLVIFKGAFSAQQIRNNGLKLAFSDSVYQIYRLPNPRPYYQIIKGKCRIEMAQLSSAILNCNRESIMSINELYMPGWMAKAGTKNLKVMKYGSLFQQIKLPKGQYDLAFNFEPKHIKFGEAVAVFGLVSLIVISAEPYLLKRLK